MPDLPSAQGSTPPRFGWLRVAFIVIGLTILFHASLLGHVRNALDPLVCNDDTRAHIPPLLSYTPARTFKGDYLAEYHLTMMPILFRGLYAVPAHFNVDPRVLAKAMPYPLLIITLTALGAAAWRLGGAAAAFGSTAIFLALDVFTSRLTGGLPRGFAFPLIAVAIAAVVLGRPYWLAAVTVAAAGLYPPVSVVLGAMLAILFILPGRYRGRAENWSGRKRVIILSATFLATVLLVVPTAVRLRPYGAMLTRADMVGYPELQGRYISEDAVTTERVFAKPIEALGMGLWGKVGWTGGVNRVGLMTVALVASGVLLSALAGGIHLLSLSPMPASRLLWLCLPASLMAYVASNVLWPYLHLPQRHIAYLLPSFTVVFVPAAIHAFSRQMIPRSRHDRYTKAIPAVVTVGIVVLITELFGMPKTGDAGYTVQIRQPQLRNVLTFLSRVPEPCRIAGWPQGPMDDVPYFCSKQILINFESHQVFHRSYTDETRQRIQALIRAYFSSDLQPVLELRRRWGVTHLLVNRDHFTTLPIYYAPFDRLIPSTAALENAKPAVLGCDASAVVYDDGQYFVIALDRLKE